MDLKKKIHHTELAASGRWNTFTLVEQMANIGSEVHRTFIWYKKKDKDRSQNAFERILELFDLTLADEKLKGRRKEIARGGELFCAIFYEPERFDNLKREMAAVDNYFLQFGICVRLKKDKNFPVTTI